MKLQSVSVSAKRVGENDVRAGLHVGAVDTPDAVRMIHVPDLGRVPGGQAGREELGSHGAIGHQYAPGLEEFHPAAHAPNLPPGRFGDPPIRRPDYNPCRGTNVARELGRLTSWACVSDGNSGDAVGSRSARDTPGMHPPRVGGGCSAWDSPEARGSVTAYASAVLHGLPTLIVAR